MRFHSTFKIVTLVACLAAAPSGWAAAPSSTEPSLGVWGSPYYPGWTMRAGAMALVMPVYEGAKRYITWPLPSFELDYDDRLYSNINSATYALFQNKWISVGPEITSYLGRFESYSEALRGLGDLPMDLKGGAFLGLHSPIGSLMLEYSHSMTTSIGATGSASFQTGYNFDIHHFLLTVAPGVTWGDRTYMGNNFGITTVQSANTNYAEYSPKSGFYNYYIYVAPTFIISDRHYIIPSFAYAQLFGEAKKSPLVQGPVGTPHEYVVQLSYQYRFEAL